MPSARRHSRTTPPPVRRPRVAGLRHPAPTGHQSTGGTPAGTPIDTEPVRPAGTDPVPAAPDADETYADGTYTDDTYVDDRYAGDTYADEFREAEPEWANVTGTVVGVPGDLDDPPAFPDTGPDPDQDIGQPAGRNGPRPAPRPSGKHRARGIVRPDDLAEAEAETRGAELTDQASGPRRNHTLSLTIMLTVLALILAGLAVWFRGEANSRVEAADTGNRALIDPATQSEMIRQLRGAIEKTLSYNYTDLDSTANAVRDNISGRAQCEYDQLFGEVRKLAPQQKIVLTTQVRDIGVTRLQDNHAQLLVFVDQQTTRAEQNQTTALGAQFAITAEQQGGKWKITEFDMLGQPMPNGTPAPHC